MHAIDKFSHKLSESSNSQLFFSVITPAMFADLQSQDAPTAIFVGGQPGAGKTALQEAIEQNISFDPNSVAKINGDEFRGYHPDFMQLNAADDALAAFHTDADTGIWVAKALEFVKSARSNMLIEGTLRNPEVTMGSAQALRSAGYRCELHVVVAHEFFSRLRIFSRYLGQRKSDGYGRYTLLEAHNASYNSLPESLASLVESKLFSRVVLYDIERCVLFDSDFCDGDVVQSVAPIVSYVRSQMHQPIDKLLVDVQSVRMLATSLDCDQMVLGDIKKLAADIVVAASAG
ncbi:MAG: zeta toxin family protein [Raoultibacter sp.]